MLKKSSTCTDTLSASDSILNATYHDVEIKQVEVINPNPTIVKFKNHSHAYGHDDRDCEDHYSSQVLTNYSIVNQMKDENEQVIQVCESVQQNTRHADDQSLRQPGTRPVSITNLPLHPHQSTFVTEDSREQQSRSREEQFINHTKALKQKHREEMMRRKQQIINSLSRNSRRSSATKQALQRESRFYEVAPGIIVSERPLSRMPPNTSPCENRKYYQTDDGYDNRAATVPSNNKMRVWTGHRSAGSRALSSVSSRWKTDEPIVPKPNVFIKMPFKQVPFLTMEEKLKPQEDQFLPGDELRATTAFALSRIRHAFKRMNPPATCENRRGRLLKARLRPMRPVTMNGPQISSCRGVQPEFRKETYSPSPSRQRHLKDRYLEACRSHKATLREEYKRRSNAHSATSDQSVHRTSPQPDEDPDYQCDVYDPVNLDVQYSDNELSDEYHDQYNSFARKFRNENPSSLEDRFESLKMESSVIY